MNCAVLALPPTREHLWTKGRFKIYKGLEEVFYDNTSLRLSPAATTLFITLFNARGESLPDEVLWKEMYPDHPVDLHDVSSELFRFGLVLPVWRVLTTPHKRRRSLHLTPEDRNKIDIRRRSFEVHFDDRVLIGSREVRRSNLFAFFFHHQNVFSSRNQIMAKVWPDIHPEMLSRTMDVGLHNLKERLETTDASIVRSVHGYKLVIPE